MMVARRNWLLRCSILINVAVLLYICSHVMIGDSNITMGPSYIYQESIKLAQQSPIISEQPIGVKTNNGVNNNNNNNNMISNSIKDESSSFKSNINSFSVNNNNNNNNNIDNDKDKEIPSIPAEAKPLDAQIDQTINQVVSEIQDQNSNNINNGDVGNVNSNNNIDNRYDIPTEPSDLQGKQEPSSESEINLMNQTESGLDLETRLKAVIKCHDHDFKSETRQRGDFWVLKNYIRAAHGDLRCLESITYTTHSDYTFLDNIIPLLERWNAPISIAMHAPGTDFTPTINAIKYLRDCVPEGELVKQFATFHIYFSSKHIPKNVPTPDKVLQTLYNCSLPPPYANVTSGQLYKTQKKLLYPVNVGRNIARDAALTHFILASDIELYPNPGLVHKFLEMIARNDAPLQRKNPRVYPLSIFEVDRNSAVPKDKTELQELLRTNKAIQFHKRVCSSCHGVPKSKEWMVANETEDLGVFHIGKRTGYQVHWEPIYIGTNDEPHYDERLSWEGKSDKMTQGYALCVLDYEFHILDNGFLVHKPGIKILKKDPQRAMLAAKTNQLIRKIIYPELKVMYGSRKGCAV